MTMRNALAIVASVIFFLVPLGCCSDGAAPIPSHVTVQEMKVYTAWLQSFHKRHPEQRIEVSSVAEPIPPNSEERTAAVDPVASYRAALRRDGVDVAAFNELARLGTAFYPMSEPFDSKLATLRSPCFGGPCLEKESRDEDVEVTSVHFSRVVFDRKGKTAFLHANYITCRVGACFGGRSFYMVATENGSDWIFKTVGPVYLS